MTNFFWLSLFSVCMFSAFNGFFRFRLVVSPSGRANGRRPIVIPFAAFGFPVLSVPPVGSAPLYPGGLWFADSFLPPWLSRPAPPPCLPPRFFPFSFFFFVPPCCFFLVRCFFFLWFVCFLWYFSPLLIILSSSC